MVMQHTNGKTFLRVAREKRTVFNSLKVALVVGSILALINYGDRLFFRHDMTLGAWLKLLITYCVPYGVATYGAAMYAVQQGREGKPREAGE